MGDEFAVDLGICNSLSTTKECEDGSYHSVCQDCPHASDDGFRLSTVQETAYEMSSAQECEDGLHNFTRRDCPHASDDGFRLSTVQETPYEMRNSDNGFSLSTAEGSPTCSRGFTLSTVDRSAVDLSQLSSADAELVRCLPAAVGEVYARRLCVVERSRRDAEESAVALEARYPRSVLLAHPAKTALVLVAASLGALALSRSGAWDRLVAGSAISAAASLSACTEMLDQAKARVFDSEAIVHRDALGYQEMLRATESWTAGALDEGGFWSTPHKPGLAFCINSTRSVYREMLDELGDELDRRHEKQAALLDGLWVARSEHLLSPVA